MSAQQHKQTQASINTNIIMDVRITPEPPKCHTVTREQMLDEPGVYRAVDSEAPHIKDADRVLVIDNVDTAIYVGHDGHCEQFHKSSFTNTRFVLTQDSITFQG